MEFVFRGQCLTLCNSSLDATTLFPESGYFRRFTLVHFSSRTSTQEIFGSTAVFLQVDTYAVLLFICIIFFLLLAGCIFPFSVNRDLRPCNFLLHLLCLGQG